jgi:hypothetical protein
MKKINKKFVFIGLIFTWILAVGCGIGLPKMPGLPDSSAATLWADVPAFPGASQHLNEQIGTSLFNQAQANEKSKMETIILYTDKKPPEIAAFYNDEMMKKQGWAPESTGETGCTQDKMEGDPRAICSFTKKDAQGREYNLTIDATKNPNGTDTRLILVRIAGSLITK